MSGYYTFYSTGFFGFGPPGTFKAYSLMHLMPILICVGLMVLVWFRRDRIREWKSEASLRLCISFLCFLMEFSFFVRLLYVGDSSGKYMMMAKVPLHVCDLGCICCMFMVTGKNRTLFGINFFVSLFGATIACVVPQMVLSDCGPAHFRYYQYFGIHLLPIFGTVYMMMVHGMRPRYRDIWYATGSLAAMVVPSIMINKAFPGANRMFLELDIPLFPENMYLRSLVYAVLIIAVFHLMWFAWRLAERLGNKGNRT